MYYVMYALHGKENYTYQPGTVSVFNLKVTDIYRNRNQVENFVEEKCLHIKELIAAILIDINWLVKHDFHEHLIV